MESLVARKVSVDKLARQHGLGAIILTSITLNRQAQERPGLSERFRKASSESMREVIVQSIEAKINSVLKF